MKLFLVLIIVFSVSFSVLSDTVISYSYDAAGNRIKREIVLSRSIEQQQKPITETFSEKFVKIYPNPTEGVVKIEITGWESSDECLFTVHSISGQLITEAKAYASITEIDLSGCANGAYLLNITINGENRVWKIIKK